MDPIMEHYLDLVNISSWDYEDQIVELPGIVGENYETDGIEIFKHFRNLPEEDQIQSLRACEEIYRKYTKNLFDNFYQYPAEDGLRFGAILGPENYVQEVNSCDLLDNCDLIQRSFLLHLIAEVNWFIRFDFFEFFSDRGVERYKEHEENLYKYKLVNYYLDILNPERKQLQKISFKFKGLKAPISFTDLRVIRKILSDDLKKIKKNRNAPSKPDLSYLPHDNDYSSKFLNNLCLVLYLFIKNELSIEEARSRISNKQIDLVIEFLRLSRFPIRVNEKVLDQNDHLRIRAIIRRRISGMLNH